MSVRGSVVRDLEDKKRRAPAFMLSEARRASRIMRDEVRDRTPVGRRIDPGTGRDLGPSGHLRREIDATTPFRSGPNTYVAGAHTRVTYAEHVERGTRPHIIEGNTHLRFWSNGQLMIRKRVNHPGAPGHFMFLRGAQAAEAIWAAGADTRLKEFLS